MRGFWEASCMGAGHQTIQVMITGLSPNHHPPEEETGARKWAHNLS